MSRYITLELDITLTDGADPEQVADAVVFFLSTDPKGLFPQIEQIDGLGLTVKDEYGINRKALS